MLWVAIDRGLRLSDKRSLPCPNRNKWLEARDELYEEIMEKAWNPKGKFFAQSYEDLDIVDSAVLIMPLVFFIQAVSSQPAFHKNNRLTVSIVRPQVYRDVEPNFENT